MTIDEMRKYYPFLCYGNEYARLRNAALYYKYLLDRITTERHASQVGHDWNKWSASLYVAWKEHRKLLAKLPKPTKEQIKDEDDPNYPWTEGKWPEGDMPAIRKVYKSDDEVKECAYHVAAILTCNDYYVKILKSKTYPSKDWRRL